MMSITKSEQPKIAKAGKLEIAINHFTTDITPLPYWMDGNCYIVFSLLWRRYISASINERLITPDGWYQYTMNSLKEHAGFKDKGTLHRTVEGLYRSGLIDVRVENGSRMWACWKMNKKNIEYVSSIPDRDALQEPYLNSINTISSSDKNFTYQQNKDGIDDLMRFFMVKPLENPPLFNTITQQYDSTTSTILSYNHNTSLPNNNIPLPQQNFTEKVAFEDNLKLEKEFEEPLDDSNDGVSKQKSKNEIDARENPSQSQSLDNNKEGYQDSTNTGLQAEDGNADSLSQSQSSEDSVQQEEESDTSSPKPQLTEKEELEQWKKLVNPELEDLKYAASQEDFSQKEKLFYKFLRAKVDENCFINEGARKLLQSYIEDLLDTWRYYALVRGNRMQSSS